MDSDGEELSSSISEWRINCKKAGRILWTTSLRFAVVMNCRTAVSAKSGYLSARKYPLRLLVAAQAVPRHQEETYRQAWRTSPPGYVLTTILMMPPPSVPRRGGPVKSAKYLDGSSGTLQSQAMLEKLMQTRVRNLLHNRQQGQRKLNLHLHLHLHRTCTAS